MTGVPESVYKGTPKQDNGDEKMAYGYSNQAVEIFAGADTDDDPENFSELVWELEIFLEWKTQSETHASS